MIIFFGLFSFFPHLEIFLLSTSFENSESVMKSHLFDIS